MSKDLEEAINNDGMISAASLPEEFQIKDPFNEEYLMNLPKEALVKVITIFVKEMQPDPARGLGRLRN